jgi:hypothetical protein
MTGDAANDTIIISSNGANLTHNRFAAGDPGFASAQDFNTTDPGDQTIPDSAAGFVGLNGGDGQDTLQVGLSPGSPASTIAADLDVRGQGGNDTLIVDDSSDATGRTVEPSIGGFSVGTGFGGGRIDYPLQDVESMLLLFGSGNDTARIAAATPTSTNVEMNGGDDTIRFTGGAAMGQAQMGAGADDTLDYSPRSDNIIVSFPNATGTQSADGFENVIGGSGDDQLSGTPAANAISGGPGADTLQGADGNDVLTGDDGADTMEGGPNDDVLQAANGAADADTALGCGTGNDSVDRDPPPTDPDSIVAADCETVNPPLGSGADGDGDGVPDGTDNCPAVANVGQENADGDAQGDACDADDDNDSVPDASDACPTQAGPASNNGCPVTASTPDNEIEIGKAKLNAKKGSAKLPVGVPGVGELELSGKNVKPVAKQASGPGTVTLKVKPKGKLADKLDDKGKAKVKLAVTFTPTGGESNTKSKKVTLKQK